MSKRAKERALEIYPEKWWRDCDGDMWDANEKRREVFIQGYEQAEKDPELTWEDIWQIVHLYLEVNANHDYIPDKTLRLICEETLKRFKERKNE